MARIRPNRDGAAPRATARAAAILLLLIGGAASSAAARLDAAPSSQQQQQQQRRALLQLPQQQQQQQQAPQQAQAAAGAQALRYHYVPFDWLPASPKGEDGKPVFAAWVAAAWALEGLDPEAVVRAANLR